MLRRVPKLSGRTVRRRLFVSAVRVLRRVVPTARLPYRVSRLYPRIARFVLGRQGSDRVRIGWHGWDLEIPSRASSLIVAMLNDNFERVQVQLLPELVEPGQVALDVGASIGVYTLALARAVGSAGIVHAVEPHPGDAEFLRRNLEANACANVDVHTCAAGVQRGRARLFVSPDDIGQHTLDTERAGDWDAVDVSVERLDALVGEQTPDLIKLDVEGAEAAALAGAAELIERRTPILVFEWLSSGGEAQQLHELLQRWWSSFWIIDEARGTLTPTTASELLDVKFTNVVAAPTGRAKDVEEARKRLSLLP